MGAVHRRDLTQPGHCGPHVAAHKRTFTELTLQRLPAAYSEEAISAHAQDVGGVCDCWPAGARLLGRLCLTRDFAEVGQRAERMFKALQRRRNRNCTDWSFWSGLREAATKCADALEAGRQGRHPRSPIGKPSQLARLRWPTGGIGAIAIPTGPPVRSNMLPDIRSPRTRRTAVGLRAWLKDSPAESSDSLVALHVDLMAVGYRCPISQEGRPAMIRTRVHSHIHRFHEGRTKLLMIAGAAFLFVTGCSKTDIEQTGTSSFTHDVLRASVEQPYLRGMERWGTATRPQAVNVASRQFLGNAPYVCTPSGFGRTSTCFAR